MFTNAPSSGKKLNTINYKLHLVDEDRSLSSYLIYLPELEHKLLTEKALGVIYVDASHFSFIEQKYGSSYFEEIMKKISAALINIRGDAIRKNDVIALSEVQGSSFLIFLSEPRKENGKDLLFKEDVENACERVQEYLYHTLFLDLYNYLNKLPKIHVGYSMAIHNPMVSTKRTIYKMIEEARNIASLQNSKTELQNRGRLQKILLEEKIYTVYQPIICLKTSTVYGYEALSRGPPNSEIEAPVILFTLAEDIGLLFDLDRLCRKRSIINARGKEPGKKLFVNTLPNLIYDPEFSAEAFIKFLNENKIPVEDIVLEITERDAIEQFAQFKKALSQYIKAGISIAIDDVGAGYSSLEAIVEIEPKYVKIDASIIRGIHQSKIKQDILKALIMLTKSVKSLTVAEGVETKEDLQILKDFGIDYAQGYYFARPGPAFPRPVNLD
jgi:EAL domain-containing protein (putative c-di-GMP-specific phosphodiesterase class I)/GGDEF domain-containing protein